MSPPQAVEPSASWLHNRSIQIKLALSFGLVLLVFVAVLGLVFQAIQRQVEARQWTVHAYAVIEAEQDVELALREIQVAVRGYTLLDDESELRRLDSRRQRAQEALGRLQTLTADHRVQAARAGELRQALNRYLSDAVEPHLDRMQRIHRLPPQEREMAAIASGEQLLLESAPFLNRLADLSQAIGTAEKALLEQRLDSLQQANRRMYQTLIGSLAVAVVLTLLGLYLASWQITSPLIRIIESMRRLANGDHAIELHGSNRKDELGAMALALGRFRELSSDVTRVKRGLDVVMTNVMVADAGYNIVYINDSLRAMLAEAENDIRKDLPAFRAARVVGANIDQFHRVPSKQRGLLDQLTGTHRTELKIGGRTFSLIVNPINDDLNNRLGMVVEWKDLTAELAARERERELVTATHQTAWVKKHVGSLSATLQALDDRAAFANTVTSAVAPLVEAGVAVFYALEEDGEHLSLLGHFGYRQRRHVTPRYAMGEGLIGQCARERKAIQLDSVPEDYTAIHSGSGEARPTCVIVLPLVVANRLLGVLEFASFAPPDKAKTELLEELLPVVALSLDNLNRSVTTRALLEETQRQSAALQASEEELRSQQDELREQNKLLNEQSAQLKASEEELRVQSEELQASNEELREQSELLNEQKKQVELAERAAQERAEALARASQYKSEFLANMSHELRTPLNSLLILARGLADNDDGHLSADEVESAEVIHSAGTSLLRLINDILDLSKIEAGRMELSNETLTMNDLESTLTRLFRGTARDKNVAFVIHRDPALPDRLQVDIGKLEQVLNNLISNAFKFTARGEVRLEITPQPGERVAFSVIDTGIGIPQDKFNRVFQAFEQVDGSTRRQYGGTGLGLSIARSLAQLMGGDITLNSTVGTGSTFTLTLPLHPPEGQRVADVSPAAPPIEAAAATPRIAQVLSAPAMTDDRDQIAPGDAVILIIEDDVSFARILLDTVRKKGSRGLVATDGESGLALARHYLPTGILLDVMLPGMDGWGVIEQLKEHPQTRAIPVHFISATEEKGRALDAGAVGFLTKPVNRDDLSQALARLQHFAPGELRRVLVIDDDAGARMAVRKLLGNQQVEVLEAESAEAALELLQATDTPIIDCIVLDLGLPGMDGFAFLEHTARLAEPPPVVVYSGRDLDREETLKLRAYTDSIVIKGARSPERLLDEVSLFLHSLQPPRKAPPPETAADASLKGKTVMVVDDDVRNMFAMSKALRSKGLKVVMAQDGHKALQQLQAQADIDLVLMDIMMPGMDGYDTMREVRKLPAHAKLPMIALTAKAMRGDREKCLEAGANDYLAKPVDLDKLFSMMRVWLANR